MGILRLFGGILLVAALAAAGQYAIDARWPPRFSATISEMPHQSEKPVVFFCDSINAAFARDEQDSRKLHNLVAWASGRPTGAIALGGYDMQVFLGFLRSIRMTIDPANPRTWILTVNLSNYSGDGRGASVRNKLHCADFRQLHSRSLRAFARPMRIFRFPAYRPTLRLEEELRRPVLWQGRTIGLVRDYPDTYFKVPDVTDDLRRENIAIRYGQPLAPDNLNLRATAEAARLLRHLGQRAVFCIVPCDVQRCDALLDGQVSPILDAKAATVAEVARNAGGEVLDLHDAFPTELFIPDQYPNEHLRNAGRERLAVAIADFLRTNAPPSPLPPSP